MALIKCGECNSDVSTEAKACPHCGAPISLAGPNSATAEVEYARTNEDELWHRGGWLVGGGLLAILLFFIPILGWLLGLVLIAEIIQKVFFSKRDRIIIGPCPVCATRIYFAYGAVGGECPGCGNYLTIKGNQFTYFERK
jgi:predicted amidophosphoribosyltransferase